MPRISQRVNNLAELPAVLEKVRHLLQYHTESGFSGEEANGYAQQLHDLQDLLIPAWHKRLADSAYAIDVVAVPELGGFLKIVIEREGADPVQVFVESYGHFNAEMFDGSCNQYVYQRILCFLEGLESGRVPL